MLLVLNKAAKINNKKNKKKTHQFIQTKTRRAQNLASCLQVFVGFKRNNIISNSNTGGFMYAGILSCGLNKNPRTEMDHITPNIAAISIICCSERWFLGSISKIKTWLTPDERHPYIFIPHRNINSIIKKGPLYNRHTILQSSLPWWKIPKN